MRQNDSFLTITMTISTPLRILKPTFAQPNRAWNLLTLGFLFIVPLRCHEHTFVSNYGEKWKSRRGEYQKIWPGWVYELRRFGKFGVQQKWQNWESNTFLCLTVLKLFLRSEPFSPLCVGTPDHWDGRYRTTKPHFPRHPS